MVTFHSQRQEMEITSGGQNYRTEATSWQNQRLSNIISRNMAKLVHVLRYMIQDYERNIGLF